MQNNYKIIQAQPEHIDAIITLWKQLMYQHQEMDAKFFADVNNNIESYKSGIKNDIINDNEFVGILIINNQVAGYITASIHNYTLHNYNSIKHCLIGDIIVDDIYQKNNYGRLLIDEVVKWTKSKQIDRIELDVFSKNEAAYRFFKHVGFNDSFNHLSLEL